MNLQELLGGRKNKLADPRVARIRMYLNNLAVFFIVAMIWLALSIATDTFGTGKISDKDISRIINEVFDLTPYGITETLDLLNRKYQPTAAFGHFGREGENFTWEQTNKVDILKNAL